MAAGLEHAHVVPIYDFWREPAGAFIVMRWMAGGNLTDRCSEMTLPQVRTALVQVATALTSAHRRGVVHGAIKPGSVLFYEEGDAFLTDFSVAGRRMPSATPADDIRALGDTFSVVSGAEMDAPLLELVQRASDGSFANAQDFAAALSGEAAGAVSMAVEAASNPYKGLRPFGEPDVDDFFGRERMVDRLIERLARSDGEGRFVAVVGPSGSGKSSVIRAGLFPALHGGRIEGSDGWFITEMVPGIDPFNELEAALLRVAVNPSSSLLARLKAGAESFAAAISSVVPDPDATLLLLVDQFEELFTLTDDPEARAGFIDGLVEVATGESARIKIVITLRADYFDRPLRHPALGELVRRNVETVVPLNPAEIERAVSGPAARVGVTVDPELQAQLVADVTDRPGSLPLLQYALTELFETRSGSSLTLDLYLGLGGIGSALGRRAEHVYGSLDANAQTATRQMFLRLTALDEGAGDTRRRALRSELTALEGLRGAARRALDEFGSHRLLTFDRHPITRSPTVEVAHEALLREWARLSEWIDTARADLAQERRLAAATGEWIAGARDPSYLLTGERLAEMEAWTARADISLTRPERAFLAKSTNQKLAAEAEDESRRKRERTLERRSRFRLRVLAGVLAVATAAAAGLTMAANRQADRAEHNLAIATARQLTAEATRLIDDDAELALLLAVEAADTALTAGAAVLPETVEALHGAVLASRLIVTVVGGPGGFSPDGSAFVTADPGAGLAGPPGSGVGRVYSVSGEMLMELRGHSGHVSYSAYSPDGATIVTTGSDGTARLWDASSGEERLVLTGHSGEVFGASFNGDGTVVATAGSDGTVRLWNVHDGTPIRTFLHGSAAIAASFSDDGRLAVAADNPDAYVWDLATGEQTMHLTGHRSAVCNIAFVPGSGDLVTAGQDGTVLLWGGASGALESQLVEESGPVCGLDVNGDGTLVVTAGESGTARVLEIPSGRQVATVSGHASGMGWANLDTAGRYLLTFGGDGLASLWDVGAAGARETLSVATDGPGSVALFSPDGGRLLTATETGTVALWDAATGSHLWSATGHANRVNGAAFSPDGATVLTVSEDRSGLLWSTATGDQVAALNGHTDAVWSGLFSRDGRQVVTVGLDGIAMVWEAVSGEPLATVRPSMPGIFGSDLSSDGELVAFAGIGIEVWDSSLDRLVFALGGHDAAILDIEFSPDGSLLASAAADGLVKLWDVAQLRVGNGDGHRILEGHGAVVLDVDFSPDGSLLATSSLDGTVKVWKADGTEAFTIAGSGPGGISFDPSGTRLAVPNADGTVRVLVVPVGELLDLARGRLTRDLTDAECVRYLHIDDCSPEKG
jgi:WD40 repeat protein/type II secretory pathway predicted ATPase ExeA